MTTLQPLSILIGWPDDVVLQDRNAAEITIELGDELLSRVVDLDAGTVRPFFKAPAIALAFWVVDNWWRLRWEPMPVGLPSADWRLRHEMSSAAGGVFWPPLMFYGSGERVMASPSVARPPAREPVHFLKPPVLTMTGATFEDGMSAFIEAVLGESTAPERAVLAEAFADLQRERQAPDYAAWRRLEAQLGFDPGTAPGALIERMGAFEDRIGGDGVEEAAVSSPGPNSWDKLSQALQASEASPIVVDLSVAARHVDMAALNRLDLPPWLAAEYAASNVRRGLGGLKGPIRGAAFADIFDANEKLLRSEQATATNLPYGARIERDGHARLALQSPPNATRGRRFELARAIGDAIWSSGASFGVFSRAKTDRQKFQRAFAQSLLCPYEELRPRIDDAPTDEQIDEAADHFLVSPRVVRTLLVNKNVLPRETLDEQLEAA